MIVWIIIIVSVIASIVIVNKIQQIYMKIIGADLMVFDVKPKVVAIVFLSIVLIGIIMNTFGIKFPSSGKNNNKISDLSDTDTGESYEIETLKDLSRHNSDNDNTIKTPTTSYYNGTEKSAQILTEEWLVNHPLREGHLTAVASFTAFADAPYWEFTPFYDNLSSYFSIKVDVNSGELFGVSYDNHSNERLMPIDEWYQFEFGGEPARQRDTQIDYGSTDDISNNNSLDITENMAVQLIDEWLLKNPLTNGSQIELVRQDDILINEITYYRF